MCYQVTEETAREAGEADAALKIISCSKVPLLREEMGQDKSLGENTTTRTDSKLLHLKTSSRVHSKAQAFT